MSNKKFKDFANQNIFPDNRSKKYTKKFANLKDKGYPFKEFF
jgi:hypothetical protein